MELQIFCRQKQDQLDGELGPDYYGEMVRGRKDAKEMAAKFAELMLLQQKKLQEAEEKYKGTMRGKQFVSPETGMNIDGKGI